MKATTILAVAKTAAMGLRKVIAFLAATADRSIVRMRNNHRIK